MGDLRGERHAFQGALVGVNATQRGQAASSEVASVKKGMVFHMGVATPAGERQLTRMPRGLASMAAILVSIPSAALLQP